MGEIVKTVRFRITARLRGNARTKSNARSRMYWLKVDKDINEIISNCNASQKYYNVSPSEPLLSHLLLHETPKDVYNELASNLFVRINISYLIAID